MSDLISRQALTNALTNWQMEYAEKDKDVERFETLGAVIELVEQLPTIEPTLYGYNVELLAMIAAVMAKKGVTPEKAVDAFKDIVAIVQMIMDEQKEIIKKAVEQWTI